MSIRLLERYWVFNDIANEKNFTPIVGTLEEGILDLNNLLY